MTARITLAGIATAFVLGTGALFAGSLATSAPAEAAPGWHGKGKHGHFGHDYRRPGRYVGHHRGWGHRGWGHGGWGVSRAYYGDCFTVLRARYVPGLGVVERPVTRCR